MRNFVLQKVTEAWLKSNCEASKFGEGTTNKYKVKHFSDIVSTENRSNIIR